MAKLVVGWDGDQQRPCPEMLEHMQDGRGICQGKDLPREWIQQALSALMANSLGFEP